MRSKWLEQRLIRGVLVVVSDVAVVGWCCGAPATAGAVQLHGKVIGPSGRPAANVQLALDIWRQGLVRLETGADGSYSAALGDGRQHWIEARVAGVGVSKVLTVKPGQRKDIRLDIHLRPMPTMVGVIRRPDGRPAAKATFEAHGVVARNFDVPADTACVGGGLLQCSESRSGGVPFSITTDSRGRYEVPLFADEKPCHLSVFGDRTRHRVHILSSQGLGWEGPIQITVDLARPEVRRDITLRPGDQVQGVVINRLDRAPMPGVHVSAQMSSDGRPDRIAEVISDEHGRFSIPTALPPGEYYLGAWLDDDWGFQGVRDKTSRAPTKPGIREVEVQMARDVRIHGRVLNREGKPVPSASITVSLRCYRLNKDGTRDGYFGHDGERITTDESGAYHLDLKGQRRLYDGWKEGVFDSIWTIRDELSGAVLAEIGLGSEPSAQVDLRLP